MEITSIFGVPAHPLFVHLPVVLTPLAALTALVMFKTGWRRSFLWVTVALSGAALLGAQLAVDSGEELEESVRESGALEAHADLGVATRNLIAVFFIVTLVLAVYDFYMTRRSGEKSPTTNQRLTVVVMTAAMVLSGVLATVWVIRTGHQGASVTWEDVNVGGGG